MLQPAVAEHAFIIKSVETQLSDGVYHLNAKIEYRFSDEALIALKSGVPLLVLMDIEVDKIRSWWFNKTVAELQQGYLLLYHALSEQFIISNLNSGTQENFYSLTSALSALGNITHLPLIDSNILEDDANYEVNVRTRFDIESLPVPMRPIAYISKQWQLDSNWVSWPLTR
jgi:hypothetical protein